MIWQRRPKCKIKSCLGHSVLHVTLFLSAKVIWCPNIFSFSVCFTKTYSRRSLCSCAVPVCPLALMISCQVLLKSDNLSGRYEADYSGLVAAPPSPLLFLSTVTAASCPVKHVSPPRRYRCTYQQDPRKVYDVGRKFVLATGLHGVFGSFLF